ncbi:uncharacterized protein LOC122509854 [Leptopilina heterotoma]|uniref:uncharacterized protein LOC122509854 n=1 Tax=Leptopilina heterotoma TaxID=63436 RepID=UPI001CA9553B|nr:uncharacterized protein LOC122509854 [Leptopilina heterotoma]
MLNKEITVAKLLREQLLNVIKELQQQTPTKQTLKFQKRKKRNTPLIGFIGKIAGPTIGILTYDDGERYEQLFTELNEAQKNISHLVGEQTHIVRADLQNLYDLAQRQHNSSEEERKRLYKLEEDIFAVESKLTTTDFMLQLQKTSKQWNEQIETYKHGLEETLNVIFKAIEGKLHPKLLNNEQIKTIATEAHKFLENQEYPMHIDNLNVATIAEISKIGLQVKGENLMITLDIPLLEKEKYLLYKMHELPVLQTIGTKGNRAYITPHSKYIATSIEGRHYFYLEEEQLRTCQIVEGRYVCYLTQGIYDIILAPSCESELLREPNNNTLRSCDIRITKNQQPLWEPLITTGNWLYSLTKEETAYLICPKTKVNTFQLKGIGIVNLSPKCTLKTDTIKLPTLQIINNPQEYIYAPKIELKLEEISPILKTANPQKEVTTSNEIRPIWRKMETDEKLQEIEKDSMLPKKKEKRQRDRNATDVHHTF